MKVATEKVTVRVWKSDLENVRYLGEKLVSGMNRGVLTVKSEGLNFFLVECDEKTYRWLYSQEAPAIVG